MFAALAIAQRIGVATGWSLTKFINATRRYRRIMITANGMPILAAIAQSAELAWLEH